MPELQISYSLYMDEFQSQRLFQCLLLPEIERELIYSLKVIGGRPLNQNLVSFTSNLFSSGVFLSSGLRIINCFHYEIFPSAAAFLLFSKNATQNPSSFFRAPPLTTTDESRLSCVWQSFTFYYTYLRMKKSQSSSDWLPFNAANPLPWI